MANKALDLSVQNVHVINSKERDAEVYVIAYCIDDKVKRVEDLLDPKLLTGRVEENINDGDDLTLGPGGILCYSRKENEVPSFLSWAIAVYESDQGIRDFGSALEEVGNDERFKAITTAIGSLLTAGSPAAILVGVAAEIVGIVGKVLKLNKDDQLFMVQDFYDTDLDREGVKTVRTVVRSNENVRLQYKLRHLDRT